jgi:predicted amidohydrolase YtcJ
MLKTRPIHIKIVASILLLTACSETPNDTSIGTAPDLIVLNADVYTSDPNQTRAQAFAIKNGRFSAIGRSAEISTLAGAETQVIDARERSILPGLIDAHIHLVIGLRLFNGVDLSYIPDKATWLKLIKEKDAELPKGQWIIGGNWDYTLGEGVLPSKEDLDAIVPDRPILLKDIDGHSAWANSKAIEMAGITANTPVPTGGQIIRNPETGEPTGIFLERASRLFSGLPGIEPTPEQTRDALRRAIKKANSYGITGVHEMGSLDSADLFLDLLSTQDLTVRTWFGTFGMQNGAPKAATARDTLNAQADAYENDTSGPLFEYGFIKLVIDGVLSTYTAVLKEPYSDRTDLNGVPFVTQAELEVDIAAANAQGFPVAVHAIGDGAVATVLNAYAAAGNPPDGLANRIEHIEVVQPEDVKRFADIGVTAVMQPNHATGTIGKYINERLGDAREKNAYVWQTMLKTGVDLVLSSDWPTSPLSPFAHFSDAVFRESPFGLGDGPWHPEEAVTFGQALTAYTQSAADLTPWKGQIGSITVGKWADFIIIDQKLPEPLDRSFRNRVVDETFLAGKSVYKR